MSRKRHDPGAAQRRQRRILVGATAVLGLVLAIQVPRMLSLLDESAAAPAAAPAIRAAAAAPPAAPVALRTPARETLVELGRFRSKDPFVQQLPVAPPEPAAAPVQPPAAAPAQPPAAVEQQPPAVAPAQPPTAAPPTAPVIAVAPSAPSSREAPPAPDSGPPARPTRATIAVDGASEDVAVGAAFPAAEPVFTLVSLTRDGARVGVAGGSLADGAPSVALRLGEPLTLMNTADGIRYTLRLVAIP